MVAAGPPDVDPSVSLVLIALAALCAVAAVVCIGVGKESRRTPKTDQKRTTLTINQKIELCHRLERGETARSLAAEYGLHPGSVKRMARKAPVYSQFAYKTKETGRKSLKKARFEKLEDALRKWFLARRQQGLPITGEILCKKAQQLYEEGKEKWQYTEPFEASSGWLHNFQKRHGISLVNNQGERTYADELGAMAFVGGLEEKLAEGGYDLEDVYNVDETGVCWRSLPYSTLVHVGETKGASANGFKISRQERFATAMCANATGTHRLPLLVIGHAMQPTSINNKYVPALYTSRKNACMDVFAFTQWLTLLFIPAALLHQARQGRAGDKILLLVDSSDPHRLPDDLELPDNVEVMPLPLNTSSLIQPMEQGVTARTKRLYRRNFLGRMVADAEGMAAFYQKYTIQDAIIVLDGAWRELTRDDLRNAWKSLLPTLLDDDVTAAPTVDEPPVLAAEVEFAGMLMLGSEHGTTVDEVSAWLEDTALTEDKEPEADVGDDDGLDEACVEGPEAEASHSGDEESKAHASGPTEKEMSDCFQALSIWARGKPDFIKNAVEMLVTVGAVQNSLNLCVTT